MTCFLALSHSDQRLFRAATTDQELEFWSFGKILTFLTFSFWQSWCFVTDQEELKNSDLKGCALQMAFVSPEVRCHIWTSQLGAFVVDERRQALKEVMDPIAWEEWKGCRSPAVPSVGPRLCHLLPHTALTQVGMKSWCLVRVASLARRLVNRITKSRSSVRYLRQN